MSKNALLTSLQESTILERVPRPGWRGWLTAVISLIIVFGYVAELVTAEPVSFEQPGSIEITTSDEPEGPVAVSEDDLEAEIVEDLAAHPPTDIEALRQSLQEHRVSINLVVITRSERKRNAWAPAAKFGFGWLGLAGVLLLLGPFWAFSHLRGPPAVRARLAWRTFPAFSVATAAVLLSIDFVATAMVDLQVLQITIASAGGLAASLTDATIHWLAVWPHPEAEHVVERVAEGLSTGLGSVLLLDSLYAGLATARESTWLRLARDSIRLSGWMVAVYGPVVAGFTYYIAGRILLPRLESIVLWPFRQVRGRDDRTPGVFLWAEIKHLWLEFRFGFWMFLFLIALLLAAAVLVRLVAFPIAWIALDVVSTTSMAILAGEPFADAWVFFSTASLGLFSVLCALCVLVPLSLALGKARWMVRARLERRARFRDFPAFWALFRHVLGTVVRSVAAGAVALALYLVAHALLGGESALWLPAFTLAPPMVLLLVAFDVGPRVVRDFRRDVLTGALVTAREHASGTEILGSSPARAGDEMPASVDATDDDAERGADRTSTE